MRKAIIPVILCSFALPACAAGGDDGVVDDEGVVGGGGGGGGEEPGDDDDGEEPEPGDGHWGEGGGGECDTMQETHVLQATPPDVMLVLDKSGSMSWDWDHDANPDTDEISKWSSLYDTVGFITAGYADSMAFGAQLFPSADAYGFEGQCEVASTPEVPLALDNGEAILAGIPGRLADVYGGTPASSGFDRAVQHLMEQDADVARYVILVTDGAANCKGGTTGDDLNDVYDDTLPQRVSDARIHGNVITYAIGVDIVNEVIPKPNTNPWESLNAVAVAGGAPANGADSFYHAANEIELTDALTTVTGAIQCTVFLVDEPTWPDNLDVTVDGVPAPHVTDCQTESGWAYTSQQAPFNAIQLCNDACPVDAEQTVVQVQEACPT